MTGRFLVATCVIGFLRATAVVGAGQPLELVAPGTIIADGPPTGWSHLVVKSCSRVTAGDLDSVPKSHLQLAEKFGTVLLAHVAMREDEAFHLVRLGVGCTTRIRGRDVVISPSTQRKFGADLGMTARMTLSGYYERQQRVVAALRAPTLAIVDSPTAVHHEGRNRMLTIRYGMVLDSESGELNSLVWLVDLSQREGRLCSSLQHLQPNKLHAARLYVDKERYRFGIPAPEAFAAMEIPKDREIMLAGSASLLVSRAYSEKDVKPLRDYLVRFVLAEGIK